jgi:hypothetical protein
MLFSASKKDKGILEFGELNKSSLLVQLRINYGISRNQISQGE